MSETKEALWRCCLVVSYQYSGDAGCEMFI